MIDKFTKYAHDHEIHIFDDDLIGYDKAKGFICDDVILIRNGLTENEYACILAEEIGHHKLSVGNILDMRSIKNQKEELKARQWAYRELVTFDKLIEAYEKRIDGNDLAEWLGVTDEFLNDAITRYRDKYGIYKKHGGYYIYFDPLGVMREF